MVGKAFAGASFLSFFLPMGGSFVVAASIDQFNANDNVDDNVGVGAVDFSEEQVSTDNQLTCVMTF